MISPFHAEGEVKDKFIGYLSCMGIEYTDDHELIMDSTGDIAQFIIRCDYNLSGFKITKSDPVVDCQGYQLFTADDWITPTNFFADWNNDNTMIAYNIDN